MSYKALILPHLHERELREWRGISKQWVFVEEGFTIKGRGKGKSSILEKVIFSS